MSINIAMAKNFYQIFSQASIFDNEDSNTNFFHFLNLK
jgi:hypothetical protein